MGYLNTDVVGNKGELLNIQSPVEAPVSSLIAHISPKQEGEGTPSLENVRPITGRTGCWVTQSGTNIGDKSYYRIGISSSWGGVRKTWGSFAANNTRVHFLFRVPQGSTITMACHNPDKYWVDRIIPVKYDTVDFSATNNAFLGYYNIALYGNADQRLKMRTYTMPEDSDGLLIRVRMLEDNVEMTEELFEGLEFTCVIGSIPSQLFVPYTGKTLHADWTDSAGTIYGGYVDLVKGVVVQTMQKVMLDGSFNPGLFPWAADVEDDTGTIITHALYLKRDTGDNLNRRDAPALCDQLEWYNINNVRNRIGFGMYDGSSYSVCLMMPKELVGDSLDSLNEYLSAHPITIVYTLKTPIEIPIDPQMLSLLRGVNHIWTDGDSVDVSYRCAETRDMIMTRRQTILAQPHVSDWITGSPITTYSGDMLAAMKNCRTFFNPTQEGEGVPTPDNVRPIKGWTGIDLINSSFVVTETSVEWVKGYIFVSGILNKQTDALEISSDFIEIKPETTYTFTHKLDNNGKKWLGISWYKGNKEHIRRDSDYEKETVSYTSPADAVYARFSLSTHGALDYCRVYDQSCGQLIKLDWSSSFGEIFGGYVDPVKGEIVQEWAVVTLDGTQYMYDSPSYNGTEGTNRWIVVPKHKYGNYLNVVGIGDKAEMLRVGIWSAPDRNIWKWTLNAYNQLHVVFDNETVGIAAEMTSAQRTEAIKAWLAENPMTFIYLLATPITYPFERHMIKSLRGQNRVCSDANGRINLRYWTRRESVYWDYEYYPNKDGLILPENNIYVSMGQKVTISWKTTTTESFTNRYIWRCIGARFDNATSSYVGKVMANSPSERIETYIVTQAGRFIAGNYRVASEEGAEDTAFIGDYIKVKIED